MKSGALIDLSYYSLARNLIEILKLTVGEKL